MSAVISGFTPTTPTTTSTSTSTSSNQLTSSDFLNLMIQQLQNQDPLNPTDSNQLLTQMSQISTLQSNTQMVDSLSALTLQQSIGSAGNLIGKTVEGKDSNGNSISGTVTSVQVVNQQAQLKLSSGSSLSMSNITDISNASSTSGTSSSSTQATLLSALQQLLSGSSTSSGSTTTTTAANSTASTTTSTTTALANLLAAMGY